MDIDMAMAAPGTARHTADRPDPADAAEAVTALYRDHALRLIRLAHVLLGNREAAQDVVQDAFCGLYRRWAHLDSTDKALAYARTAVLNGCRSARQKNRAIPAGPAPGDAEPGDALSAEAMALLSEKRREVIRALWRLPERQRDVLVLRYYLDVSDDQIARDLDLAPSSVRSARHRALSALKRALREEQ